MQWGMRKQYGFFTRAIDSSPYLLTTIWTGLLRRCHNNWQGEGEMNYPSKKDLFTQGIKSPQASNFLIFASYSTKDIGKVIPILNQISAISGVKTFIAERDLQPGDIISQRIIQQIRTSDIFLLFLSESTIQSNYVQQEIGVARACNRIIIPLRLDKTKPPGMIADSHYLDLSDEPKRSAELERLYIFIRNNIQTKNQNQLWGALILLGIGALLSLGQETDDRDDY